MIPATAAARGVRSGLPGRSGCMAASFIAIPQVAPPPHHVMTDMHVMITLSIPHDHREGNPGPPPEFVRRHHLKWTESPVLRPHQDTFVARDRK